MNFGLLVYYYLHLLSHFVTLLVSHICCDCKLRCYQAQVLHYLLFQESINNCHRYLVSDLIKQLLFYYHSKNITNMINRLDIRFNKSMYYICL